ncbi:hypothetical protein O181_112478 [Austropuccinia psidii MF-1]|uniref:Uncharacterized protein n=1 Tax=Austropuccinia psidii MF-1 TaxID=1389203 RepID=A0A9Q3PSQ5_9BASI|nr:hypothetical protein [Austropuccinia psidii MF-1]
MIKCSTHSAITASKLSNCAKSRWKGNWPLRTGTQTRLGTHPPTPALVDAPITAHAHTNATPPHPRHCAAGSTSVIWKMIIPRRRSPLMDDLVRSNPPSTSTLAEGTL